MSTTYALYLESGPKRRKTMTHALDLLGCVAVGPTTDEALAATPAATRAYLRFPRRHGVPEAPNEQEPFNVEVIEHTTEIETNLLRLRWLCDELADWVASRSEAQLDV